MIMPATVREAFDGPNEPAVLAWYKSLPSEQQLANIRENARRALDQGAPADEAMNTKIFESFALHMLVFDAPLLLEIWNQPKDIGEDRAQAYTVALCRAANERAAAIPHEPNMWRCLSERLDTIYAPLVGGVLDGASDDERTLRGLLKSISTWWHKTAHHQHTTPWFAFVPNWHSVASAVPLQDAPLVANTPVVDDGNGRTLLFTAFRFGTDSSSVVGTGVHHLMLSVTWRTSRDTEPVVFNLDCASSGPGGAASAWNVPICERMPNTAQIELRVVNVASDGDAALAKALSMSGTAIASITAAAAAAAPMAMAVSALSGALGAAAAHIAERGNNREVFRQTFSFYNLAMVPGLYIAAQRPHVDPLSRVKWNVRKEGTQPVIESDGGLLFPYTYFALQVLAPPTAAEAAPSRVAAHAPSARRQRKGSKKQ